MYKVFLKRNKEKRLINGFPWVYANEVDHIEGKDVQGAIAQIFDINGRFVAKGYINHASKILLRVLSRNEEEVIDEAFLERRIRQANDYRLLLGYDNSYRVVFGESDQLPALIVDKYGDYLCCQFLSLGMEKLKPLIVKILIKLFAPLGIYERSDSPVRLKEGLPQIKGPLYGTFNPKVLIEENGLKLYVDMENGQKTGYFLDQKENRANLKHYVKDRSVLDCFCNVGGFSLCAARYGAKEVTAVDISKTAIASVEENAALNGLKIKTLCADVFEQLRIYHKEKQKFDVVILDPPAFTKSVDTVKDGYRGYKDINILGLKLVKKGGFLITCSCSQHLTVNLFLNMLKDSVIESGVQARMVEFRTQGKDHPTMVTSDESLYLKLAVLEII